MSYLRELMAANVEGWPTDPDEQEKEIQVATQNPKFLVDLFRSSVEGFDKLSDAEQSAEMNLALRQHERTVLGEKQPLLEAEQAKQAENVRLSDVPLAEGLSPTTALQTAGSLAGSVVKSVPKFIVNTALGAPEVLAKGLGFQERGEEIEANRKAANKALDYLIPTPPVAPPFSEQWEAGIPGAIAALPLTGAEAIAPMATELAATAALTPIVGPVAAGTAVFGGSAVPESVSRAQEMGGPTKSMVALGATKAMLNGAIFSLPMQSLFGKEAAKTISPSLWGFVKEAISEFPKTYGKFAPAIATTSAIEKGVENFAKNKNLSEGMTASIKAALFNAIPMNAAFAGLHAAKAYLGSQKLVEETTPASEEAKAPETEKVPVRISEVKAEEKPRAEKPLSSDTPSESIVPTEIKPSESSPVQGGGITRVPDSWTNGTLTPNEWARTVKGREPTPSERAVTHLRALAVGNPETRSAAFIDAINLMNENPINLEMQRRGTITNEQMKELADKTPMNLQEMLELKPGDVPKPELSVKVWDAAATFLMAFEDARGEYTQAPTQENFSKMESLKTVAQKLLINAKAVSTEYGRGLQAQKTSARAKRLLDETLQELENIQREESDQQKAFTIWDKWYELYINSLLSGVRTHTSNITGTVGFLLTQPIIKATGTVLDLAISGGKNIRPSQNIGWVYGLLSGIQESARLGLKGLSSLAKSESPVREFYVRLASAAKQPDAEGKFDSAPRGGAISGAKGEFIRTPTSLLSTADNIMKSWIYSASAYEQAYREARDEGKPLFSEEFNQRVSDIVRNPDVALGAERGAELRDKAVKEARYLTYTQKLGPFMQNMMKLRQTPGYSGFLAKVIFPFVSTTANIGKITLEHSPLNFLRLAKRYTTGELKSSELAAELAKPVVGSAIGGATVMMATQGLITGYGPKDPGERKNWLLTHKPYSIKIGNSWYSYDKLEPLGSVMGMAADLVELAKVKDEQTYGSYAQHFALSIGSNLANKTFVRQLSTLMQAWTDPQRYGQSFIDSLATSMVPAGGALNTLRQAKDPLAREAKGPKEAIMNRLPGLSELLLERRDILGRQISLGASAFARAVSPVRVSIESDDPVDKWMSDMNLNLGYPSKTIKFAGKQIKFDPIVYDRILVEGGKKVYDYLNKIRESNKPEKMTPQVKEARAKRINAVISNLRESTARRIVVNLKLYKEPSK